MRANQFDRLCECEQRRELERAASLASREKYESAKRRKKPAPPPEEQQGELWEEEL